MRCQICAEGGEGTSQGVAEPATSADSESDLTTLTQFEILESVCAVRRTFTESHVRPSETRNSREDSATSDEKIDFHPSVVKVLVK